MADESYKLQRRDEMTNHGVRGLFLLNGGGAVALLAFLQQIWTAVPALAPFIVWGLVPMVLGVAMAAGINFVRVESALHWSDPAGKGKKLAKLHRFFSRASIGCFVLGMITVITGAMANLPDPK